MQASRRSGSIWPGAALAAVLLLAGTGTLRAQNWSDWNRNDGWNHDSDQQDKDRDHRDEWRDNNWRDRDRRDEDRRDHNGDVTEAQKNACKPDVFRLCSWYIPNREKITACLHQNISKLNRDCRAVMEGRLR